MSSNLCACCSDFLIDRCLARKAGTGKTTTQIKCTKILQSILQNTLEQSVLAVFVHSIWVVVMPVSWATAVLAAAIMFFAGRALFTFSYEKGAPSRAIGFVLTFYPSVLMLAIIVVKAILELVR